MSEHLRVAVVKATEAIEDGDTILAREILWTALEDVPQRHPRTLNCPLPGCSFAAEWPGELDHHLLMAHPVPPSRSAGRRSFHTFPPRPGAADRTGREQ